MFVAENNIDRIKILFQRIVEKKCDLQVNLHKILEG